MNEEISEQIKEEKKYAIFIGGEREHIVTEKVSAHSCNEKHKKELINQQ